MVSNVQIGSFQISMQIIRNEPGLAYSIMEKLQALVVRAEVIYHNDMMQYTAISPMFEGIPATISVPDYDLKLEDIDGKLKMEVTKL